MTIICSRSGVPYARSTSWSNLILAKAVLQASSKAKTMVVSSAVLSTVGRLNPSAPPSHPRKTTTTVAVRWATITSLKEAAILVLQEPNTTRPQCLTSRITSVDAIVHELKPSLAAQNPCTISRPRMIGTLTERVFNKCPPQLTSSRCPLKKPNSSTLAPSLVTTCQHKHNSWLWQLILLSHVPLLDLSRQGHL